MPGVVHFLGGAVLGAYPQVAYDELLQRISDYGSLVIVATPFDLESDHRGASAAARRWSATCNLNAVTFTQHFWLLHQDKYKLRCSDYIWLYSSAAPTVNCDFCRRG
jgi:hypothetical protein